MLETSTCDPSPPGVPNQEPNYVVKGLILFSANWPQAWLPASAICPALGNPDTCTQRRKGGPSYAHVVGTPLWPQGSKVQLRWHEAITRGRRLQAPPCAPLTSFEATGHCPTRAHPKRLTAAHDPSWEEKEGGRPCAVHRLHKRPGAGCAHPKLPTGLGESVNEHSTHCKRRPGMLGTLSHRLGLLDRTK